MTQTPSAVLSIDASRITVAQPTGTEAYALNLIRALLQLNTKHRWRLYFRDQPPTQLLPRTNNVEFHIVPVPRLWSHLGLAWGVARHPSEGLFIPAHVRPLFCRTPTVITVHDLGYLHFPQTYPLPQRIYLNWATYYSARRSSHIIADSRSTRADLLKHYQIDPAKVTVVHPGFDPTPFADAARTTRRSDLPSTYLLHVGTLQPRKNLLRLLEALATLRDHPAKPCLVCVGRRGWLDDPIRKQVQRLRLQARVRFLGYVSPDELPNLYAHAIACVAPSLYEGFGFTPLEAMACGTPVVCSDGGSLPEVVGDAALVVPCQDTAALTHAIRRVLPGGDAEMRRMLITRGHENIRRFAWTQAAQQTLMVLENAFSISRRTSKI